MLPELKDSGGQRAIYIALEAVIQAHTAPDKAAEFALAAVERELVALLNTPTQYGEWLDAYQDMHEQLKKYLRAKFGEQ